jgi:hypothetical protein
MSDDEQYLAWGQTPFDKLSRDELLRHCQRLYAACSAMHSDLSVMRVGHEHEIYWECGAGADAIEQGEQALAAVNKGFDKESIYRSFFRYARDLLFESKGKLHIGFNWFICDTCGIMRSFVDKRPLAGKSCDAECPGVFRAITWNDLKPSDECANITSVPHS